VGAFSREGPVQCFTEIKKKKREKVEVWGRKKGETTIWGSAEGGKKKKRGHCIVNLKDQGNGGNNAYRRKKGGGKGDKNLTKSSGCKHDVLRVFFLLGGEPKYPSCQGGRSGRAGWLGDVKTPQGGLPAQTKRGWQRLLIKTGIK